MSEREEEQPVVKVTDRRKFNLDGSMREGVEIEPPKPKVEEKPLETESEIITSPNETSAAPTTLNDLTADANEELPDEEEMDIPGANDPASFVNFLSTLATNAAAALGAMPHPITGQKTVDLDTGKYWLDVLAMLKEKTKGNLHPQESRLFEGVLTDLRMQYVQLMRMTEEKLKAQAAQKFSASDILGKK